MKRRIFITGTSGFIGFHLARLLLESGWDVHGFDGMTDYYDVGLKEARRAALRQHAGFADTEAMLEDAPTVLQAARTARPDVIVHLAAQAGVRYSLEAPGAYVSSNINGTFHVIEAARELGVTHLLMASTSSVYGAETDMPFRESMKADTPLTIYAATKKATEAMGHSYAHLHGLPTTMFRFFTVYGEWGRPDMAYFKFAQAIRAGRSIDVYNHGEMWRDFTYVGDLVRAIALLIDAVPPAPDAGVPAIPGDSLSQAAPFRVVNIGNNSSVKLTDFISALERALGARAQLNMMEMQVGDVPATWADASLLKELTGYAPETSVADGLSAFARWYDEVYSPTAVTPSA